MSDLLSSIETNNLIRKYEAHNNIRGLYEVFITFYKLPKLLNWFSFSIGYHHIHHLFPTIPGYNLKQCYDENPMFQDVSTVTLWDTPDIMKLRLYDDVKLHRLIAWKEYHKHYPK